MFSPTPTGDLLWWKHFSVGGHFVSSPVSRARHAGHQQNSICMARLGLWPLSKASCLCLRSFSCVSPDLYVGVDVLSWSNWSSALLLFTYWKQYFLWKNQYQYFMSLGISLIKPLAGKLCSLFLLCKSRRCFASYICRDEHPLIWHPLSPCLGSKGVNSATNLAHKPFVLTYKPLITWLKIPNLVLWPAVCPF